MEWFLNGTHLGEFKGLKMEDIEKLDYKGEWNGIKVFTAKNLPGGTIELWDNGRCIVSITGLEK